MLISCRTPHQMGGGGGGGGGGGRGKRLTRALLEPAPRPATKESRQSSPRCTGPSAS